MFNFDNEPQNEKLNKVISDLLEEMEGMDPVADDKAFGGATDNLVKLIKLRNDTLKIEGDLENEDRKIDLDARKIDFDSERIDIESRKVGIEDRKLRFEKEKLDFEKEKSRTWKPSPDAIVTAAASIIGIVAILHYEKIGVVTSKALGFVGKMK